MLNYTVKNLSKSGFFLGGSNSKNLQKNIVPFLFCSRNSFYIIDVLEFLNHSKKLLFLFQKLFLNRSNILIVLESFSLKKRIDYKLNSFFNFLNTYKINKDQISTLVGDYYTNSGKIEKILLDNSFLNIFSKFYFFYVNNKKSEFNSVFKTKPSGAFNFKYLNVFLKGSSLYKSNSSDNNSLFKSFFFFNFYIMKKNIFFNIININFFIKNLFSFSLMNNIKDTFILNRSKNKKNILNLKSFLLLYSFYFSKLLFLFSLIFKKNNFFNLFKQNNKIISSYKKVINSILLNVLKTEKSKIKNKVVLDHLLRKLAFKKYNMLLFVDKRLFYVKKWLVLISKLWKKTLLLKTKQKYLLNLLSSLLKFKKKIVQINKILHLTSQNENNHLEKFSMNFKNNYIKENLLFWNGKWLNGSLTNFYGLKRDLKKEVGDFKNLKKLPEFISLFSLKNNEGFLNEVSILGLPFSAVSDTKMDPFFFHYYMPSNNNNGDILYFFTLLLLESFLRGYLKEINTVAI